MSRFARARAAALFPSAPVNAQEPPTLESTPFCFFLRCLRASRVPTLDSTPFCFFLRCLFVTRFLSPVSRVCGRLLASRRSIRPRNPRTHRLWPSLRGGRAPQPPAEPRAHLLPEPRRGRVLRQCLRRRNGPRQLGGAVLAEPLAGCRLCPCVRDRCASHGASAAPAHHQHSTSTSMSACTAHFK